MAKPNARPSCMAMVSTAARPRQPHRDKFADAAYEGFFQILKPAKIMHLFYFILFSPPSQLYHPQND